MTFFLHEVLRDCIPERYVIRSVRAERRNDRTGDSVRVIGEFADMGSAYDATVARSDAQIYRQCVGDFDKRIFGRGDWPA